MNNLKLIELTRTCIACPSQWEGKLSSDEYIYIRYRHSFFSVGIGTTLDKAVDTDTFVANLGLGEYDGDMSDEDMLLILKKELGITQ